MSSLASLRLDPREFLKDKWLGLQERLDDKLFRSPFIGIFSVMSVPVVTLEG